MVYEAPHLKIKEGDIKSVVCAVGDPARAELIATKYCDSYKELAYNREYRTFNVTYQGAEFSVASHGVGGPGAAICFEELIKCGAKVILRLGTCGSLKPETIDQGDLIVTTGSGAEDGVSEYLVPKGFPAVADPTLCIAMRDTAKSLGYDRVFFGITVAQSVFYPSPAREQSLASYAAAGAIGAEMENSALFNVASIRGIRAAAICTVDGSPLKWDEGDYDPHGTKVAEGKDRMLRTVVTVLRECSEKPLERLLILIIHNYHLILNEY
ncbi:purine nucleoside phosphorylase, putative [Perkinsus marinus ATCC 50983]|uniref:Purine nucleoside phosphorylase, putative n=1 Tax=Perkinsus marinus (strain ATCC 50983 / TXsc) TaxID=423536 RepID=C5LWL6_PERM5|nr:purine nucleoside phosphorylase, putative [Perkinsus marinus ATCC 50983]EEQ98929.1 purine nucleoside phosphorylase, putative [Perkinsus marinus ATCC 50983]|eukprot:XP_002766212.1 purine nucleoside phosphorylase, putative [Perkinsus marinus ATCC 50983]